MTDFAERIITIDGARVRVLEAGAGPAMVILGRATPAPLDVLLAKRARVVILPAPPDAVARAATALGIDRFTAMAQGEAAATVLALAAQETARVRSVVVLAPSPLDRDDPALGKIAVPVLALFGTRDDISPPARDARRWRAGLADCHVVMIYDAGHDLATERPEAVAELVLDFVEHEDRFLVTSASGLLYP